MVRKHPIENGVLNALFTKLSLVNMSENVEMNRSDL